MNHPPPPLSPPALPTPQASTQDMLPTLVEKTGDANTRIKETAQEALLFLGSQPEVCGGRAFLLYCLFSLLSSFLRCIQDNVPRPVFI